MIAYVRQLLATIACDGEVIACDGVIQLIGKPLSIGGLALYKASFIGRDLQAVYVAIKTPANFFFLCRILGWWGSIDEVLYSFENCTAYLQRASCFRKSYIASSTGHPIE